MMRQQFFPTCLRHLACALFLVFSCGLATANAQTGQPVVPFLDELVVNPTTGLATAYFGYNNPNSQTTTIAVGQPRNFFFQPPEDRGQPSQFLPGVRHYAFAAIIQYQLQPTVTWILNGLQATAFPGTAVPQPQTSTFTYQGRLSDGALPATGTYPMQFSLYDAATGGTQIGTTLTNTNVNVSNGLFSVQLNFGSSPFTGADRYLEIAVKHAADSDYTTLAPRQQLTAAPFAIHTINATSADALSNACVGCVTNSQIGSVAGNKITGNVGSADNATTAITAGSVSGIVPVANGGTGSSTQNFVDLSTDQSNIGGNKTFNGILSGNGSGLTNVPGTFRWQVVAGTSQQAVVNTGYLTTSTSQVTITLPAAPNVGDVIRVSGVQGGWRISQNAGQSIYLGVPTTVGPAGYLIGGPLAAIELQYIGNGQFVPLSHEGTITVH
jgi:hypothetical protein